MLKRNLTVRPTYHINIFVQRALGINRNIIFQKVAALGKRLPELPEAVLVNSRPNAIINGAQCTDSSRSDTII
jgi:hypothetical protein